MDGRRFRIETLGCQMNIYDSEVISDILIRKGHVPAASLEEADVVLVNTCSVRARAERRAMSRIRELARLKRTKPGFILGVVGCMAQRLGGGLLAEGRAIDIIMGPDSYDGIADAIVAASSGRTVVDTCADPLCMYSLGRPRAEAATAFVAVARGCGNYCSYCVVPYVRGPERSKPHRDVLAEVERLADTGVKEVTLIGQNVNSYRDGPVDFPALLEMVSGVEGVVRIRFTTSHPKDLSSRLIRSMGGLSKVCEHLHLPLQSGSDRILALMNRAYTYDHFRRLVDEARGAVPDLAVTTDIMVGFPSESVADFQATLRAVEEIEFDAAFMFRYSSREGTRAASLPDDVSEGDKTARLQEIIRTQNRATDAKKIALVGREVEVLVEGPSGRERGFMLGRTRQNWLAKMPLEGVRKGEAVAAIVVSSTRWMVECRRLEKGGKVQ